LGTCDATAASKCSRSSSSSACNQRAVAAACNQSGAAAAVFRPALDCALPAGGTDATGLNGAPPLRTPRSSSQALGGSMGAMQDGHKHTTSNGHDSPQARLEVAKFAFDAAEFGEDCLSLAPGMLVERLGEPQQGWVRGRCWPSQQMAHSGNGKSNAGAVGWYPADFVEPARSTISLCPSADLAAKLPIKVTVWLSCQPKGRCSWVLPLPHLILQHLARDTCR